MLCRADRDPAGCGADVEDVNGIVGTAATVGIVGADTEPVVTGTATCTEGGPGGGVREPSIGAVAACWKSRRGTPIEAPRTPAEPREAISSLLALPWQLASSEREEAVRSSVAPAADSRRSFANSIARSWLFCWPSSPSRRAMDSCSFLTCCSSACRSASSSRTLLSQCNLSWSSSRSRSAKCCLKSVTSAWTLAATSAGSAARRLRSATSSFSAASRRWLISCSSAKADCSC
mmetsp:Transcript_38731/g.123142  ORF Transcript_38731/g.123142 Transcript_38731/m.123142 type:complete len:233 (-) Transcript_38731:507-1205(-)